METTNKPRKVSRAVLISRLAEYLQTGDLSRLPYGYPGDMEPCEYNVFTYRKHPKKPLRLIEVDKGKGLAEEISGESLCGVVQQCTNSLSGHDNIETCEDPDKPLCLMKVDKEKGLAFKVDEMTQRGVIRKCLRRLDETWARYCLTFREIERLAAKLKSSKGKEWKGEWPYPIGFKSEEGLFQERRDFDPIRGATFEQFPTIAYFLRRTTNAEALCHFVGSILAKNPIRDSYPLFWSYDYNGVYSLFTIIRELLGKKVTSQIFSDRFKKRDWHKLEDTVGYFVEDVMPSGISNLLTVKKHPGDEQFTVRPPYKDGYDIKLHGSFLFLVINRAFKLKLPRDVAKSDLKFIPCRMNVTKKWFEMYKKKGPFASELFVIPPVTDERPAFAGYCLDLYYNNPEGYPDVDHSPLA